MSSIDLDPIVELSSLEISPENKQAFQQQLDKILNYMSVLNTVTTQPSSKFEWPLNKDVLVRDDKPVSFSHNLVEKNAPEFKSNSFVVPKILKG